MQLLAAKDVAGVPLPDTVAPEPPSEEAVNAAVPLPEAEEDFSRATDELYASAAWC